jgi:protein-tyrosine kinase
VSGAGSHVVGIAARAPRLEDRGESVLDDYPQESGPPRVSSDTADRLPRRTGTVLRPAERAPLARPGDFDKKLVVNESAAPIAVEQYRRLAGTLHDLQSERGLKTLMVTSALPNEGKTLTVANLALTLSESCRDRVLLIDADLRRPSLHKLFRLSNANGLSDVLSSGRGDLPLIEITEHFSVLPAGHSDQPMAGLTSDRMRALLEQCAATFDWVLLDAAPIGFMPDAQLLAHLTGAVLFVIEAQSTPYQLVTRAIAEIDPECVIGSILNCVAEHAIPAAGYYREYYATARTAGSAR